MMLTIRAIYSFIIRNKQTITVYFRMSLPSEAAAASLGTVTYQAVTPSEELIDVRTKALCIQKLSIDLLVTDRGRRLAENRLLLAHRWSI